MSNILLAYNNRATGATFAGGSYTAGLPRSNLGTSDIDEVARTSSAALANTRFRFDLAASRSLRTLSLINHNLSTAATVRLRTGRAVFDVDWASYTAEDRATFSGGAGGSRVTSAGLVAAATTPRINHDPVSLAVLGLLIEMQRSNLQINSEDLSSASYTKTRTTVTVNTIAAPSGAVTADKIVEDTTVTASHYFGTAPNTITASGGPYAVTTYVHPAERTRIAASMVDSVGTVTGTSSVLETATGTVVSGSQCSIKAASTGSWWRVAVYGTPGAGLSSGSGFMRTGLFNAVPTSTYTGDGVSGVHSWGRQIEEASADYPFETSYIPTTSAQVTRTADSITVTGSNFTGIHSATAGTLYAEFNLNGASGTRPIISLDDNTANERIEMYVDGTSLKFKVVDGGVTQCDITIGTVAADTFYKAAVAWQANDFTGCLSGMLAASPDTSGTLPTVDRMRIGSDQAGNYQNGHQKRTARFLERLTNAELQLITTSGIDALGYDSGWVNALRFSFIGDTPTNWGEQYAVMFAFDAITARYGTLEINDTANAAGYVQAGRLFVGDGFQPTNNAEYGRQRGRNDLSSSVTSISGKKFSTARRRPRTVDMRFPVLSIAEANHLDEMADAVGTTEEVFYVPDPADMELSQRQGFLAHMRELGALEDSFYENVATPYRLEEKL